MKRLRRGSLAADAAARRALRDGARATHRLEAFSDIVIGFSLAEIGLSLVLPAHAIDFVTRPSGIFAFILTFVVVVRFWWMNDVIFEHYFVPNRVMTACNFVALASLILQIFGLQLYLHFVPLNEGATASRIYFSFFAMSYGVQGLTLAFGILYRRRAMTRPVLRAGIRKLVGRAGLVAGSILGNLFAVTKDISNVYVQVGAHEKILVADFPTSIFLYALVGGITGAILGRIVVRFLPAHDERQTFASDT